MTVLRIANGAITPITRTLARLTATTALTGSTAASLSAPARGIGMGPARLGRLRLSRRIRLVAADMAMVGADMAIAADTQDVATCGGGRGYEAAGTRLSGWRRSARLWRRRRLPRWRRISGGGGITVAVVAAITAAVAVEAASMVEAAAATAVVDTGNESALRLRRTIEVSADSEKARLLRQAGFLFVAASCRRKEQEGAK